MTTTRRDLAGRPASYAELGAFIDYRTPRRDAFIDECESAGLSLEAALARLPAHVAGGAVARGARPATTAKAERAATYAELEAMVRQDVPDRGAFIVACEAQGLTLAAAQTRLQEHLIGRIDAAKGGARSLSTPSNQEQSMSRTATRSVESGRRDGLAPVMDFKSKQRAKGPASRAFWDKVDEVAKARGIGEGDAIKAVQHEHHDMLNAYLLESNGRTA